MNEEKITLPHIKDEGLKGLWLDDEFLWDFLPRLSPMAVYIYLALGRYQCQKKYISVEELADELIRPVPKIKEQLFKLKNLGLLNQSDIRKIIRKN